MAVTVKEYRFYGSSMFTALESFQEWRNSNLDKTILGMMWFRDGHGQTVKVVAEKEVQ